MKIIYLILFFSSVLFSCNRKQEQTHIVSNNNNSIIIDSTKMIKDTISSLPKAQEGNIIIYGSSCYDLPRDEKELNAWRKKVLVEGDSYYYYQLDEYYSENYTSKGEMIKLTQAMINIHEMDDGYKLLYYYNVKESEIANKDKYMRKAVKYLMQLARKKSDFHILSAKRCLAEIYLEGVYVKKDTVIANYLYNGGCNIDSIIQARKIKSK